MDTAALKGTIIMLVTNDKKTRDNTLLTSARKSTATDSHVPDYWTDWAPQWTQNTRRTRKRPPHVTPKPATVHDQQETHSPTQGVSLKISAERQHVRCQRRIVDARLWDAMTHAQQDAALDIARAYETMGRGLGYAGSDWERIPGSSGSHNMAEAQSRLVNFYIDWTKACHKNNISHALIIDVLVFGFSCRAVDRDRRQRTGTCRQNLMQGLTLYAQLQGWARR
jgi:hypothetical protein